MLILYLIDPSTKQNNVYAINERKYLKCIGSGRMGWERAGPWLVHVGSMHLGINMMVWWSCLHLHNSKITPYKYRSCPFTETTASTVITNILSLSSKVVCYFSWLYNRSGYWLSVPRSYLLHMRIKNLAIAEIRRDIFLFNQRVICNTALIGWCMHCRAHTGSPASRIGLGGKEWINWPWIGLNWGQ